MNVCEQIRCEFQNIIIENLGNIELNKVKKIISEMDKVFMKYDISIKSTDIITQDDNGIPFYIKEYIADRMMEGLSELTISNYKRTLSNMFFTIRKPIEQITPNEIRLYLYQYQKDRNISNHSLETYRIIICAFFKWAQDIGYISQNPARSLRPIKYEKKHKSAMNRKDLVILEDSCKNKRERAIVTFLFATGCRIAELARLDRKDVNFDTFEVHLFGKGNKHRTSYINDRAAIALKDYLDERTDNKEPLFISNVCPHERLTTDGLRRIIENVYKRANKDVISVPKVTPHVYRHTTATIALQSGMPIQQIQKMLGHENINTTMQYLDVSTESVHESYRKTVV